jgi:putative nucleotidyltransferase with HDIG domain
MKKLIEINKVTVGMILAQDVLSSDGKLLIKESTVITPEFLNKIKNLTPYHYLHIYFPQAKIDIIVETAPNKSIKLDSTQIEINQLKNKIEIKKKLKEIEKKVEKSFHNLSINEKDEKAKKEIDLAIEDIKRNIAVSAALLEEITVIKNVDEYLYNHSINVAILAHLIGKWLDMPEEDLDILTRAGLLHDIGKLKIDPEVLNKPSRLNEEEFKIMKKHSTFSYKLLKKAGYNNDSLLKAVIFHHEKEDGSGYPLGISGEDIPLHAKILSVADIFDAMTSERVYKKRVSPFKVLEMFQNEAFGKLDLYITMIFVKKFSEYYIGSHVTLSNGEKGKIVCLNHYEINKPLLAMENGKFLDISKARNVEIIDFLTFKELTEKALKKENSK